MIRAATHTDFEGIYQLCAKALSESVYKDITPDELKIRKSISRAISGKFVFCWVSVIDDEIAGILAADVTEPMFTRQKIAGDLMFYVSGGGDGLKLIKAFQGWSRENRVSIGQLSISYGGDYERTGKLFELAGYQKVGGIYVEFPEYE